MNVVHERVLSGKGYTLSGDTGCANKYLTMGVEPIQGILQFNKVLCSNCIAPHDIAEIQESCQTLDHFRRNMASNSSEVDLMHIGMNMRN
jgi:hypothetical protein